MTKSAIISPKLSPPVGPFSQAVRCQGYIYLSGQVGQDPATGKLVPGGVAPEAEQLFRNVAAVLEAGRKELR
ncbi:MAG TPA: Rid family hydrolase [Sphingomicrobium sp.]|nr:Rid family hydrolase [Sphingomicrobium sp.]